MSIPPEIVSRAIQLMGAGRVPRLATRNRALRPQGIFGKIPSMHMWLAVAAGLAVAAPPETKICPNGAIILLTQACPAPAFIDPFIVFFDFDSADITSAAAATLDNAVAAWPQIAGLSVTLAAHTDRSGPADDNLALSRRRANSVRAYLIRHGVPDGSILIEALGESRPLVETADGMREPQNRRVEISFGPGGSE